MITDELEDNLDDGVKQTISANWLATESGCDIYKACSGVQVSEFIEEMDDSELEEAVEKYNGKFLIRGGKKINTEGRDFVRTVVIEFSTFDITKKFFYSSEYQAAHKLLDDRVIRNHQIIEGT